MRLDPSTFATTDSLFFPLVAASSQSSVLIEADRIFIKDCIVALSEGSLSSYPYYEAVVRVLDTLWASDGSKSLDNITREMGFELGLF
jgi:hypothetical protein